MSFVSIAQEYISEGFNPLPLKFDKSPDLEKDHNFLYEPINNVNYRFKKCKKIGIVCGTVSGGFYCIDFDRHGGQDLDPIYSDFKKDKMVRHFIKQGKLTCFKTPSNGYHFYLKFDTEVSGTAISRWNDKEVMIELRGNGQYIACSPSEGYEYIEGVEFAKLDYLEKGEFDYLINLGHTYNQLENLELKHYDKGSGKKWPDRWDDSKPEGKFNNEQADYAKQLLVEAGWKFQRKRRHDDVELWCRPGKEDATSATFGKMNNMFYCFTPSALPFEQNKAYSPFNIYTLLKHNGSWQNAKDSLKPKIEVEPEPIPELHSFFPIEVFPDFIRNYITELNRTLNFHVDFSAAAAMFAIATMNGNKYKLQVKRGWEAPTIFWFACVGYPGTIKTHPVKTLTKPITTLDAASKHHYDLEMASYDPDKKLPKPKFKQILISDYTIEALHSIHDINRRGIGLYKDELKGFLNDMNKYRKGSDEEFWLESFNNGSYIVNRVTKEPVMINNICINIIGTIQHDVLTKVISEYAGNGLIDRFLFTASETTVYNLTEHEIEPDFASTWQFLLSEINRHYEYSSPESTDVIQMSREVFKVYQSIDSEYVSLQNSEDFPQEIKNYLSKMKTYVPRFALLLGIMDALEDGTVVEVSVKNMVDAKKIADYFVKTAQTVYQVNGTFMEIKEIEQNMRGLSKKEKIAKLYDKGFKQTELAKYFGISKQAVHKILTKK